MDRIFIRKDTYFDSVFLMSLSAELGRTVDLEAGYVVLATPANRQLLEEEGFAEPELAQLGPTDLVIALRAEHESALAAAETLVKNRLSSSSPVGASAASVIQPVGLEGGLEQLPDANLALISVPGTYAAFEADKALSRGLNVMIFSDNVPLEDEVSLKQRASAAGLLLMGPDCGTAVIQGIPLGFANHLRRGPIGLIGASGTGLQEVSCQIDLLGGGVSQIIGTGGRDLSQAVGGSTTLAAIDLLAASPETEVLVVVSKPPADAVAKRVIERLATLGQPSVVLFLGERPRPAAQGVHHARTLREAAWMAFHLLTDDPPAEEPVRDSSELCQALAGQLSKAQRYLHGLYTGGTLGHEALLLLRERLDGLSSNLDHDPGSGVQQKHTLTDLGADEFTRGRPHPMIDPTLRSERITRLGGDPETAVLLLDVVLGTGCHPDPAGEAAAAVIEARRENPTLIVIGSVTGTELDRPGRLEQQEQLRRAGVQVMRSNAEAAELAAQIMDTLAG